MASVVTGAIGSTGTSGLAREVDGGHVVGTSTRSRSNATNLLDEVAVAEDEIQPYLGRPERRVEEP